MQIVVIYGFLGSGKTTLINRMLKGLFAGRKVVIIENESGRESVDGDMLRSEGFRVVDLVSGCVCCTLRSDLAAAIDGIGGTVSPDIVLIEPSGLASLEDMLAIEKVRIDAVISLVDASRYDLFMRMNGEYFMRQFRLSPVIFITKCDLVDEGSLDLICGELARNNPQAVILRDLDELDYRGWTELVYNHCRTFSAWVTERTAAPSRFRMEDFPVEKVQRTVDVERLFCSLRSSAHRLVRAKGLLWLTEGGDASATLCKVDWTERALGFTPLRHNVPAARTSLSFWWLDAPPPDTMSLIDASLRL
jgi:G3E family GTPase